MTPVDPTSPETPVVRPLPASDIRLAATIVPHAPPPAARRLHVLHGIYGRGRNWGAVARHLATRRPDWACVLLDLRHHGASPRTPPPHTVEAAAADVVSSAAGRGEAIDAILGHSFGGKVALRVAAARPAALRQVWVIDATPGAGTTGGEAWRLLQAVRALPPHFASRQAAVAAITAAGFAPAVAEWMTTNLERDGDRYVWALDLGAMEALLEDFFRVDLWAAIEEPPEGLTIHVVKATGSDVLAPAACGRIEAAGRRHGRVQLHRLPGGHWIHTDNPQGIIALLARELPRAVPADRP